MRLLFVEDDSIASGILAISLRKQGWIVEETTLSEAACQLAGICVFYPIIMDFGLPDLNGPEILCRLQRHAKKTPIFIISGDRLIRPTSTITGSNSPARKSAFGLAF